MKSSVKKIALLGLMVAVLVAVLSFLNWLPSVISPGSLRKYRSVEEVKKGLHITRIFMPAFLPEDLGLVWPPGEIYGQTEPYALVIMHFQRKDGSGVGLVVQQIDARADRPPEPRMKFSQVKEESKVIIKGRQAKLVAGICSEDRECQEISWTEGGYLLRVRAETSLREVVRVAQSMVPD